MPLLLLVAGMLILVSAIRGTEGQFFGLLKTDIPAFSKWTAAIIAIGLIGYIPELRTASRILLAIVFFVLIAQKKGAFANFQAAFANPAPTAKPEPVTQNIGPLPVSFSPGASQGALGVLQGLAGR